MGKLKRPALNRPRERRIEQEIIVDAYTPEERAIGWHCYRGDKLRFPFQGATMRRRASSSCMPRARLQRWGVRYIS